MATEIKDGVYFLHGDGRGWEAAEIRGGEWVTGTDESNAATHAAARDRWAGVVPGGSDVEVSREEAEAVVRAVKGEADPEGYVVTRRA